MNTSLKGPSEKNKFIIRIRGDSALLLRKRNKSVRETLIMAQDLEEMFGTQTRLVGCSGCGPVLICIMMMSGGGNLNKLIT